MKENYQNLGAFYDLHRVMVQNNPTIKARIFLVIVSWHKDSIKLFELANELGIDSPSASRNVKDLINDKILVRRGFKKHLRSFALSERAKRWWEHNGGVIV